MIRLWNRVGWYRTLAVLLLVGAVGGGVAVAADRQTQQPASASADNAAPAPLSPEEERQLAEADTNRLDAERAARQDAQRKAEEAAAIAAEQAKTTTKPSTSGSGKPKPPPGPPVHIPASCNEYSGNRAIGCALLLQAGFGLDQMGCLDRLFTKESGWNHRARNPGSGAYGIPQALPGPKMATAGADWETNPATQIKWGLGYIKGRYGTPCGAWAHSQSTGWY